MTYALAPIETRLYHLYGIDYKKRRQIVNMVTDYIEIFDEVDVDPLIEKRFRLWEQPGFGGNILLASVDNYPGPTDADATANANAAIRIVIDRGISSKSYTIEQAAPGSFNVTLISFNGAPLARSPILFGSEEAARAEVTRIQNHLFRLFSTQGLYFVEHHLLFPIGNAGVELVISEHTDPYSFQMTVVLPSGYARDFSSANSNPPEIVQSILHGHGEFRRYAERQIREHCPAQILSRILWVDRALPGTAFTATDPCFDAFEEAYRNWLQLYFTDEVDGISIEPARNALTTSLNGLYVRYGDI